VLHGVRPLPRATAAVLLLPEPSTPMGHVARMHVPVGLPFPHHHLPHALHWSPYTYSEGAALPEETRDWAGSTTACVGS
jgi:hypothetical protein